jgi:hypothetical protein
VILTKGFFFVLQGSVAIVVNENPIVEYQFQGSDNTAFSVSFLKIAVSAAVSF